MTADFLSLVPRRSAQQEAIEALKVLVTETWPRYLRQLNQRVADDMARELAEFGPLFDGLTCNNALQTIGEPIYWAFSHDRYTLKSGPISVKETTPSFAAMNEALRLRIGHILVLLDEAYGERGGNELLMVTFDILEMFEMTIYLVVSWGIGPRPRKKGRRPSPTVIAK